MPKTLAQWQIETHKYAHLYNHRYALALNDPERCSREYCTQLGKISANYFHLNGLLLHLQKYGKPRDEARCLACKFDTGNHIKMVAQLYAKYENWIQRAMAF